MVMIRHEISQSILVNVCLRPKLRSLRFTFPVILVSFYPQLTALKNVYCSASLSC